MNYQDAVKFVKETRNRNYVVVINGKKHNLRLFTNDNILGEYGKGMRGRGFVVTDLRVMEWESIDLPNKDKQTPVEKLRKNLNKVIKYLDASGLWSNINSTLKTIASFDDEQLNNVITLDYSEFNKFITDNKMHLSYDELWSLINGKIKSINYDACDKEWVSKNFANAIANKTRYSWRWTKGYDNSIECSCSEDGIMMAWYSEEYRGCGNGHYYLAIDAKHALFVEHD
jgi:hypothetical protein